MSLNPMIAYCGVDCSLCPDYLEKKCPTCRATAWDEDDECMPVACCRSKGIECCGQCADFPCVDMAEFYKESESHAAAFERMRGLQ